MATNAEVTKNDGESGLNLLRRFSKRVQGAQVIPQVRAGRYFSRPKSKTVTRKSALKRIARRDEITELIKLGKMVEKPKRGRR